VDAEGELRTFIREGCPMNYPIWELTTIGGGSLIALIAVLHVYISHLAVGGGLFLWLTDLKAVRTNDSLLLDFVRRHTWFFLLLTMVFGGVSGVGIWFIIALVHPAATSTLIHTFVFGWAIEWVFFVGEITALLLYHYKFSLLKTQDRLRIAFLYFLFAWLSMVIINGILSFMLTPGSWLATGGFWDGFFNPTYFSSLIFRTCMAVMIAGLFGYVTAAMIRNETFRNSLMAYCSKWLLIPLIGFIPAAVWYYFSLPAEIEVRSFVLNPQSAPFARIFVAATFLLFLAGILFMRRSSLFVQRVLTGLLLVIGLSWIGGFEYMREISRKPFVIGNYMYNSAILMADIPRLNEEGVLPHARWAAIKEITNENRASAGEELFRIECLSCHTVNGIRNDIGPRVKGFTYLGILAQLTGQGKVQTYMPPFIGTEKEKEALAFYLSTVVNGDQVVPEPASVMSTLATESVPVFDAKKTDYVLLVWNDLGMHCLSDGDSWFSFLPPANTLEAQLIKRGDPPVLMVDNAVLSYFVQKGFENPSAHSDFWKHSESLYGKKLENNIGLFGKGVKGTFDFDSSRNSYIAAGIPVVPYNDDGSYNPFPIFTVEARDKTTGALLIVTKTVAPVSAEIGCRNCHGGGWRTKHAGLSDSTAINILSLHDRRHGTELLTLARSGKPQLCQSCHPDPVLASAGTPGVVDFSAAMHGWHAHYVPMEDSRSCALCHPSNPQGSTQCLRDPHAEFGMGCVDCHGTMATDAASLLRAEAGKPPAARLLKPLTGAGNDTGASRVAWNGEVDCLNCHDNFQAPTGDASGTAKWTKDANGLYRKRTDDAGVRCPACHGSPHAMYPARNPMNRDRDNIQPLQYSGSRAPIGTNGTCAICHRKKMQDAIHHPNMERPMRNSQLLN
jgi:mono/diheme cytochrome c family protein